MNKNGKTEPPWSAHPDPTCSGTGQIRPTLSTGSGGQTCKAGFSPPGCLLPAQCLQMPAPPPAHCPLPYLGADCIHSR